MNEVFSKLILILVICFSFSACAAPKFQVSVPSNVPSGVKGEINDNLLSLYMETIDLEIQLQNYNAEPGATPLTVWFGIRSKSGAIILDPNQVILKTTDNNALKAYSFLKSSESWQSPRAIARGCGPRRYSFGWAISKVDISIDDVINGNPSKGIWKLPADLVSFENEQCFMFWFDTDRSPALPFTVTIEGVTKNRLPVIIPEMQFEQGKIGKVVPVP